MQESDTMGILIFAVGVYNMVGENIKWIKRFDKMRREDVSPMTPLSKIEVLGSAKIEVLQS